MSKLEIIKHAANEVQTRPRSPRNHRQRRSLHDHHACHGLCISLQKSTQEETGVVVLLGVDKKGLGELGRLNTIELCDKQE